MAERSKVRGLATAIALLMAFNALVLVSAGDPVALERQTGPEGPVSRADDPAAETAAAEIGAPDGDRAMTASEAQAGLANRPTAANPPKPGNYTWRTHSESVNSASSTTQEEQSDSEETYRYELISEAAGDTRVRRHTDYREGKDGDFTLGGSSYSETAYRREGVFEIGHRSRQKNTDSTGHTEEREAGCDWDPPVAEILYPLSQGTTWEWKSTCRDEQSAHTNTQTLEGSARIEGWENARVDGVDVLTVKFTYASTRQSESHFAGPAYGPNGMRSRVTFVSAGTQWFAPSLGLTVRSQNSTTTRGASRLGGPEDFDTRSDSTTLLVSTSPR